MNKIAFALAAAITLGIASPVFAAFEVTANDGTVIGRDPDLNVRQQMKQDYQYLINGAGE